jgi:hypothetical protein
MKFCAVKKWEDGGETVMDYFESRDECLQWIAKQPQPQGHEWWWCVGEFDVA